MAFMHGSKARVYVNGYNMSTFLRNMQAAYTVDTAETSTFGNTFKTYVPGLEDATVSCDGIFDGGVASVNTVFEAALSSTTEDIFTFLPQGDTAGAPASGFSATTTNYQVTAGIGDVSQVTLQGQNNTGMEHGGKVVHILTQETSDGQSASVDGGAASANGWAAISQITQAAATLTTLKLQDSPDNSVWTDVTGGGFTTLTANSAQRIASASGAALARYVRVLWDLTTSATFSVVVFRF